MTVGMTEVAPEGTPDVTTEGTTEVAPEGTPEVAPEITPEVAPEITPEVAPEVIIDTAPGASLVVRVAPYVAPAIPADQAPARHATVGVAVADPGLAGALASAVAEAIRTAAAAHASPAPPPIVRLRSRKRLARVAGRLAGAIAIVGVTARNARHLVALVDGVRAAGAAGVQLVWDGADPPRARVERHVFAALERARATPSEPPVVLATSDQPVSALHILVALRSVAHRSPSPRKEEPR